MKAPLTAEAMKLIAMLEPHSQAVLVMSAHAFLHDKAKRRSLQRRQLLTPDQRRDHRNWQRRWRRKEAGNAA